MPFIREFNAAYDDLTTYFAIEIVQSIIALYKDAIADGHFEEYNNYMTWIKNRQLFYDNIIRSEDSIIRVILGLDDVPEDQPGIPEDFVSALLNTLNVDTMMALINEMLNKANYKA